MKKCLLAFLIILFMAGVAYGEPWLVCDTQTDATGYIYTLNGGAAVTVPYATIVIGGTTYARIADCAAVPAGAFTYQVRAYKDDPVWGRLESAPVPFVGTRPALGVPSNVGIKR